VKVTQVTFTFSILDYMRSLGKLILVTLILLLAGKNVIAQSEHSVIVSLNMNDCISCYGHLRYLSHFKKDIAVTIVLPSKYGTADSTEVKNSLGINDERYKFIWSDTLNRQLMFGEGISSVSYANKNSGKIVRYSLKNGLDNNLALFFNKMSNSIDTFKFEGRVVGPGNAALVNRGTLIYSLDNLYKSLTVFNMISGKVVAEVKLNNDLTRQAFISKFNNEEKYNQSKKITTSLGIAKTEGISSFSIDDKENISLLSYYVFFQVIDRPQRKDKDTFNLRFYVIHEFDKNGKYLSTGNIGPISVDYTSSEFLADPSKFDSSYYGVTGTTMLSAPGNEKLLEIMHTGTQDSFKRYFAAYFSKNSKGNYEFSRFYEEELPGDYKNYNYNFANIKASSSGKYFNLPLSSNIYDARHADYFPIEILTAPQFEGSPFKFKTLFVTSDIQRGKAYYLIWDNIKKIRTYSKWDIITQKLLRSEVLELADNKSEIFIPDNIDCNYLLYPINENTIVRKKVL
jgi:hypothetical protein